MQRVYGSIKSDSTVIDAINEATTNTGVTVQTPFTGSFVFKDSKLGLCNGGIFTLHGNWGILFTDSAGSDWDGMSGMLDWDNNLHDGSMAFGTWSAPLLRLNSSSMAVSPVVPQFRVAATTVSSDSSTGALKILGGLGIGGDLNVGGSISGLSVSPPFTADPAHGSLGAPSFAFTNETSTGFWRNSANSLQLITGGSAVITIANTTASFASGTVLNISSTGASALAVTGGVGVAKNVYTGIISPTSVSLSFPVQIAYGTASAPGYTFKGYTNSGMYGDGGQACLSVAGTQYFRVAGFSVICIGGTNTSNAGIALGYGASLYDYLSTAIGYSAYVLSAGVAIGRSAAGKSGGVGIGQGGQCLYDGSSGQVAIGSNCQTTGYGGIMIGYGLQASYNVVILGSASYAYMYNHLDGTWHGSSDERFKQNIQEMNIGMELLDKCTPITFKWKQNAAGTMETEKTHCGFTYQNLVAALTAVGITKHDAVTKVQNEEYGNVAMTALIAHIVRGLVELEQKIEENEALLVAKGW